MAARRGPPRKGGGGRGRRAYPRRGEEHSRRRDLAQGRERRIDSHGGSGRHPGPRPLRAPPPRLERDRGGRRLSLTGREEAGQAARALRAAGVPEAAVQALLRPPRPARLRRFGDEAVVAIPICDVRRGRLTVRWRMAAAGADHLVTVGSPRAVSGLPGRGALNGVALALHALLEEAVDAVPPLVDRVDARLWRTERRVLDGLRQGGAVAHGQGADGLIRLKRDLVRLRRSLSVVRDAVSLLQRGGFTWMGMDALPAYAELYDHLLVAIETLDTERDLLASALEVHLAAVANRMNGVIKSLTVLATLVTPLTLVTGIYGMNFSIPETQWRYGYFFALGLMALMSAALFAYFRRRGWL
jgi:hypothetical protein